MDCNKLILDTKQSIAKYKPITNSSFFELNELFIILDIIHLIQEQDINILSINDFSLIEFIKYMKYNQNIDLYLFNNFKFYLCFSLVTTLNCDFFFIL